MSLTPLQFVALLALAPVGGDSVVHAKRSPVPHTPPMTSPRVTKSPFGKLPDGTAVDGYTITNDRGTVMHVITYGGIITSLRTADKAGKVDDIVLGYDSL